MERKVLWSKPTGDDWNRVYTSKCGRYRIAKKHYASGRNGYFNTVVYKLIIVATDDPSNHDSLRDAKDEAEMNNDPNWEPA